MIFVDFVDPIINENSRQSYQFFLSLVATLVEQNLNMRHCLFNIISQLLFKSRIKRKMAERYISLLVATKPMLRKGCHVTKHFHLDISARCNFTLSYYSVKWFTRWSVFREMLTWYTSCCFDEIATDLIRRKSFIEFM